MTPTTKRTERKAIPNFGIKGRMGVRGRLVRGWLEDGMARVQWREGGRRHTRSYPDTVDGRAEAVAFAEGVVERLKAIAEGKVPEPTVVPKTVREIWDAYVLATFDDLRVRTRENYTYHWRRFEAYFGAHRLAAELTREHLDALRRELRKAGVELNQRQHTLAMILRVYAFAVDRDLIPPTKVLGYTFKKHKDEKKLEVPEYTRPETEKLIRHFDPRSGKDWRAWVAIALFSLAGSRSRATLHLEWRDVDFQARTIHWRPELAKTGEAHTQAVPDDVLSALWVAYGWRTALGYTGPYVFFRPSKARLEADRRTGRLYPSARRQRSAEGRTDKPWTYQAAVAQLRKAERKVGVRTIKYRGFHGFRRMVVGDVLSATGNLVLAGQYIGDKDLRTLRKSYVRTRPEELRAAADVLQGKLPAPTARVSAPTESATEMQSGASAETPDAGVSL